MIINDDDDDDTWWQWLMMVIDIGNCTIPVIIGHGGWW